MTTAASSGAEVWNYRKAQYAEEREEAYRAHLDSLDWARKQLDQKLRKLDEQEKRLAKMKDDAKVLVRYTAGPPVSIYHLADNPCRRVTGKGRSLDSYEEWLEGEARSKGLKRCTACWW